jgi:UDP-glucose 4-epimerase
MALLITGASGFVMSVLARQWLDADPKERAIVLDAAPLDAAARRYFAPVLDRLTVVVADVTQPATWRARLAGDDITRIVHGATITPISRGTEAEAKREPEAENPGRIIDVNVMGTVAVLDWARTSLRYFQVGLRAHHRALWRLVRPVHSVGASVIGLWNDGSRDRDA